MDEQLSIELVACEWTLAMGSIGLLSWDRVDSCHGIEWSLVMGSIGLLSWDRLESCHGINWGLVIGSIRVPKEKLDEQLSIQLVACEWTLVMGSI